MALYIYINSKYLLFGIYTAAVLHGLNSFPMVLYTNYTIRFWSVLQFDFVLGKKGKVYIRPVVNTAGAYLCLSGGAVASWLVCSSPDRVA